MLKNEPLYSQIIVRPMKAEATSKGGIDIPLDLQKKPSKGLVLAIGCGLHDREMKIKVGATVFFIYE